MATQPQHYNDLIDALAQGSSDGIIASRYMAGADIYPPRPAIKRWGSRLFYKPLVYLLFGLSHVDSQCGAKVFKRKVIEAILPELFVDQWGFDVELLYWAKRCGFQINELPTTWNDQTGSKLNWFSSGFGMIGSLFKLRWSIGRKKKSCKKQNRKIRCERKKKS